MVFEESNSERYWREARERTTPEYVRGVAETVLSPSGPDLSYLVENYDEIVRRLQGQSANNRIERKPTDTYTSDKVPYD